MVKDNMVIKVKDQVGNIITLNNSPKRFISLVPSQTELLFDLGLNEEVVAITKFCVHPNKWFRSKKRIGGTKTINIQLVKEIKPDLIIANKEENVKDQVEELAELFPVYTSDIATLEDSLQMISDISQLVNNELKGKEIIERIKSDFDSLQVEQGIRSGYLIWKDPFMAAGGDTFINDLMKRCGFINIFQNKNRYPEITIEDIKEDECQLLMLSSEPYPFKEKHIKELQKELPGAQIVLVDGEMFSWYGSRLLHTPAYFAELISKVRF